MGDRADAASRPLDPQRLSAFLDRLIPALLARRMIQVVISGEEISTLPSTLDCLSALNRSGYFLRLAFSHSACQSTLQAACMDGLALRGIDVLRDDTGPKQDDYCQLYFPALSTNSLSKIALGIRDNLASRWAFHALAHNKPVIITLNAGCRNPVSGTLPPALQARLTDYIATLSAYGFTIPGSAAGETNARRLITLSEARQLPDGEPVYLNRRTLITPAARDELRARGISLIPSQETLCIWQK